MAITVEFNPYPVLNVDQDRLGWFFGLDTDAERELKVVIKDTVFSALQEALIKHSSLLPYIGQILMTIQPLRWQHNRQRYSMTIITYSVIENVRQSLHLSTHIAITDWRSSLMEGLRDGMKANGTPLRFNRVNLFISPQGTPLAELVTLAVHGLGQRSNDNEIQGRQESTE